MLYGKRLIALCTSRVYDAQVNEFIRTLNSLLDHRKYILFIFSINNDMYWEDNNVNAGTSVYSLIDFSVTDAVIIMDEKIKSKSVSGKIAAKIRKYLDRFNADAGLDYTVSASCGYCTAVFDESFDFAQISRLADENMYKIKKDRKDDK